MLSRKSSRIYLDEYDLNGLLTSLKNEISECEHEEYEHHLRGAYMTIKILLECNEIRDQQVFMSLFKGAYENFALWATYVN